MGHTESKYRELKLHELYEYAKVCGFSHEEIKQLYIYYQYFSSFQVNDGMINYGEFCKALGLEDSLVVKRIFRIFDENEDNMINFREFLIGLTRFLYDTAEQKIKLSYRVFDIDHKGYCTKDDIAEVLKDYFKILKHVKNRLPQNVIDEIVNRSLEDMELEGSDKVTYQDYMKWYFKHIGVSDWLTIDIEKMKNGVIKLCKGERKIT